MSAAATPPPAGTDRPAPNDAIYWLAAVAVGAAAGVFGAVLHLGVARILVWPDLLRRELSLGGLPLVLVAGAVAAVMVTLSVWLVRRFAPLAGGSGVQEVEGAIGGVRQIHWRQVLAVKSVGSFLSLGSGLVVGPEGPTIHIGAATAQGFSQWLRLPGIDQRAIIGCGAAAGLTAAFGAPVAGILFVLEETRRQFPYSFRTYTALILASVTSGIMIVAIAGRRPFMDVVVNVVPLAWLPGFVLLGVVLGALGVVFNRCLIWSLDFGLAIGRRTSAYLLPALVGFAVGVLLVVRPEAATGGDNLAVRLIEQNVPLAIVATILVVRFFMTMGSYSTGAPGGIFAPILSLAAAAGLVFALVLSALTDLPAGLVGAFAVAAMGGLLSSTVRTPLTGIVLVAELTGVYANAIPVILTCVLANLVAKLLGGRPIYEVLLERTLALAGESAPAPDGQPGSPARSTRVGSLDRG